MSTADTSHTNAQGWYGPPQSRRFHYIGTDGRSLCGKWFVLAWNEALVNVAYGPADGDCAACKRTLAKRQVNDAAAVAKAVGKTP